MPIIANETNKITPLLLDGFMYAIKTVLRIPPTPKIAYIMPSPLSFKPKGPLVTKGIKTCMNEAPKVKYIAAIMSAPFISGVLQANTNPSFIFLATATGPVYPDLS